MPSENAVYTVGHSTRSLDELLSLLQRTDIEALLDVRSVPRSRRHPQFNQDVLSRVLADGALAYRHEKALGGFRRPRPDSPNGGWDHPAFRGYADYMDTAGFQDALDRLQTWAREHRVCLMCAEAQWWRCHRRLIADALVIRGWTVLHLGLSGHPVPHELTPFAVVEPDHRVSYPSAQGTLPSG